MRLKSAYAETKNDEKNYNVTLAFILDETKLKELEELTLYVDPPTDKNNNPLGEPIEIDIPTLMSNN